MDNEQDLLSPSLIAQLIDRDPPPGRDFFRVGSTEPNSVGDGPRAVPRTQHR